MYWDNIIRELSKYGNVLTWEDSFMAMEEHDNIAGVRLAIDDVNGWEVSIISHKYSYGGKEHLFEIMPGINEDVDGFLNENEVIEIIHQLFLNWSSSIGG